MTISGQELRRQRTAAGICPTCGKNPRSATSVTCEPCRDKDRENIKARRLARKAKRLCLACGEPVGERNGVMCMGCARDNARKCAERRQAHA